jgi:hypothetical protein
LRSTSTLASLEGAGSAAFPIMSAALHPEEPLPYPGIRGPNGAIQPPPIPA